MKEPLALFPWSLFGNGYISWREVIQLYKKSMFFWCLCTLNFQWSQHSNAPSFYLEVTRRLLNGTRPSAFKDRKIKNWFLIVDSVCTFFWAWKFSRCWPFRFVRSDERRKKRRALFFAILSCSTCDEKNRPQFGKILCQSAWKARAWKLIDQNFGRTLLSCFARRSIELINRLELHEKEL